MNNYIMPLCERDKKEFYGVECPQDGARRTPGIARSRDALKDGFSILSIELSNRVGKKNVDGIHPNNLEKLKPIAFEIVQK